MVALYKANVKQAVIAKRLGRSGRAVESRLRLLGISKPRKHKNFRRRVLALYRQGRLDVEIADILGVPPSSVWRLRDREGLPPNITRQEWGREGGIASGVSRRARRERSQAVAYQEAS